MDPKTWFLVILFFICAPVYSQAQNIIDGDRKTQWNQAGIPEGIPHRTVTCATLSPGVTVIEINAAIKSCPSGQVVWLTAGTYNLSAGITFVGSEHKITLRGAGPDKTILVFSAADGCGGIWANICVSESYKWASPASYGSNVSDWTAGYAQGTTQINLTNTSGLSVGSIIILDQL